MTYVSPIYSVEGYPTKIHCLQYPSRNNQEIAITRSNGQKCETSLFTKQNNQFFNTNLALKKERYLPTIPQRK